MVVRPALEPLRRWDPERIGPYLLLGRLGAGAMGQVFLGRSTAGRLVAVKTIEIEFAEEAGFRARFAHEVAAARRVSGVFTAAVVAADADADMPWLATAYVPAPSLHKLVRTCGPLPVPATRWLAAGCAEALESIHLAGLVHRDLKPSNVLVSPDGPRVIGQPVPEHRIGVEPLQLVAGASGRERVPGDLGHPGQRGDRAGVKRPGAAPHQCDQEELGHRVQVDRQQRRLAVATGPAAIRAAPQASPPPGTITASGRPSSNMARDPTSTVPARTNQPPEGSSRSSIRGSLIR
jgi:serine/threonine protein kinase